MLSAEPPFDYMCLTYIQAYKPKLHLRMATRATLRGTGGQGGAEDGTAADAAPGAAFHGLIARLRLLIMPLATTSPLSKYIHSPAASRLSYPSVLTGRRRILPHKRRDSEQRWVTCYG